MSLELLELLATVNIPQADRLVIRPTDELRWIRRVEMDATDPTAVALELLELLATVNIPQADRLVTRPTDELRWIRRVEMDAKDRTAAIVSNVSFTGNCSQWGEAKKTERPNTQRLAKSKKVTCGP